MNTYQIDITEETDPTAKAFTVTVMYKLETVGTYHGDSLKLLLSAATKDILHHSIWVKGDTTL